MHFIIIALLEKEMATLSSILAWKIPWSKEPGRVLVVAKSQTRVSNFTFFLLLLHQLHLRSSGTRSQRLGTLALDHDLI